MALEMRVTSLDSISDDQKSFYKADGDGFVLDINGYEDPKALKDAIEKERQAAKDSQRQIKELRDKYKGIDPDKVKGLLSKLESDDEAKLMAAGKLDEVVNGRLNKHREEFERANSEANARAEAESNRANGFERKVLENSIRAEAAKAGLHSYAIDDAIFRAKDMFSLDKDGNAVQLDANGGVVFGKDGKTAFSPGEWLGEMKEKAPHWFPAGNSGGGATGGANGTTGKELSKLSPRERLNEARRTGAT